MKAVTIVLTCAALVLTFALPGLFAVECPVDATKLLYYPDKPVIFKHETHKEYECKECHHNWDGEADIQACGSSGCHDVLDKKDKTEKSLYNVFHGRGTDAVQSCVSCHRDKAGTDKEKRKELTGCMDSACHPK